ncbi:MAG: hypothetical protein ABSG46_15800 [Candidatus Binataceae bacterium]|jgi:hypothetical protein
MATLIDAPEFTLNEVYAIQQADPVEGAAPNASFAGLGISNQPHQQLANRTAFLKQRQDANIGNIAVLQAFAAGFTGSLQTAGYLQIPINDIQRGQVSAMIQWGYYSLPQIKISQDTQYSLTWPIRFPNAILIPPLATNYYFKTGGMNLVVSAVAYSAAGATFVLDVPGDMLGLNGASPEITNGFSWIAIGF